MAYGNLSSRLITGYRYKQDDILTNFIRNLVENQQELEPEFAKILDEHLWEMLECDPEHVKNLKLFSERL